MISRTALFACVLSLASFALAGCTTETEASSSEQELTQADGVAVPFDQMRREQTAAPSIATQDGVRGDAIVMPGSSPAKDFEDANLDLAQQRPFVFVDGVVREAPLH